MRLLGLVFMLCTLLIALTTSSPLTKLSRTINTQNLIATVAIKINYAFASYYYAIPNTQYQTPPPQFININEIEFTENYQLWSIFSPIRTCLEYFVWRRLRMDLVDCVSFVLRDVWRLSM
ncbi:hypothetical protein E6O75_ATG08156 [Venturia nashicola]|uniref:Uncharacterized protein n=1 Tax=Venturia nashicola TaxID=86259 RepID=A0A4Z1P128_9PEZI|nr:hypothetical protein E6O75_ATG08156 [Venturia nashicola]